MKKLIVLTLGLLFCASAAFAGMSNPYPVQVVLNSDGTKTIYGSFQNTHDSATTNDYMYLIKPYTGFMYFGGRDSAGDFAYGTTTDAGIIAAAESLTDTSYIYCVVDSSGVITTFNMGQYSYMQ